MLRAPERFAGRPIEVCYTVKNTGDAPANGTVVEATLPAGASFRGASTGGALAGGTGLTLMETFWKGDVGMKRRLGG